MFGLTGFWGLALPLFGFVVTLGQYVGRRLLPLARQLDSIPLENKQR